MYPVLISSFITLTTFLLDIYGKCRKPLYKYITLFFLIAGISFFFKAMKAEASDFSQYAVVAPGEPTLRLIAAALAIGGQYNGRMAKIQGASTSI